MKEDLYKLADDVESEQDLLQFIAALASDRADEKVRELKKPSSPYGPGVNGWENGTIDSYLEAASAWGEATITGLDHYTKPENPWKRVAHILHGGKFYE